MCFAQFDSVAESFREIEMKRKLESPCDPPYKKVHTEDDVREKIVKNLETRNPSKIYKNSKSNPVCPRTFI